MQTYLFLKLEATSESVPIFENFTLFEEPFHDRGIEIYPLICSGFYMIGTSVMKELNVMKTFEIMRTVILNNISNPKAYLGPCQPSMMKLFNPLRASVALI